MRQGLRPASAVPCRPFSQVLHRNGAGTTTARRLLVPTDPTPTDPTAADPAADPPAGDPPAADPPVADPPAEPYAVDWKAKAREWEKRAKANSGKASEYDKLVTASQTETERAQSAAQQAEQRVAEMQGRIAAAEIKAALTGVVPDPAAVVDDLNLARFVNEDGEVDGAAVKTLREKYEAMKPAGTEGPRTPAPTPGQGANTQPRAGQITREQLDTMKPDAIVKARRDGLLNDILGIKG